LRFLSFKLAAPANGFSFLPGFLVGWLFKSHSPPDLTKQAFALKLLFQHAQRLVNVVVSN
jgi:hypothetical protein